MKIPIIVLGFDRPNYLRPVLESLSKQPNLSAHKIVLFLDGSYDTFNNRQVTDPDKISACRSVFEDIFPDGTIVDCDRNLGIAGNFLRAERYAFEELDAPYAYFLEDDMVLGNNYLDIISDLASWAAFDPSVATFAAYGLHNDSLEMQQANAGKLTRMIWNWAFGLSRLHWKARHELMAPYYDMVLSGPYRNRPRAAVVQWCRTLGWGMISPTVHPDAATSQDSIKTSMSAALGASGLMTRTVHAKYIGEVGTHFNPSAYASHNFAATELHEDRPPAIRQPSDQELRSFAYSVHQMRELRGGIPQRIADFGASETPEMLAKAFGLDDLAGIDIDDLRSLEKPLESLRAKYPKIDAAIHARRAKLADLLSPLIDSLSIPHITTVETFSRRATSAFYLPNEILSPSGWSRRPDMKLALLECELPANMTEAEQVGQFVRRGLELIAIGGRMEIQVPLADAERVTPQLGLLGADRLKTMPEYQSFGLTLR